MKVIAYGSLVLSSLLVLLWPAAAYASIFAFDAPSGGAYFELKIRPRHRYFELSLGISGCHSPYSRSAEESSMVVETYYRFSPDSVRPTCPGVFACHGTWPVNQVFGRRSIHVSSLRLP
jgi:hypothetical protein